MKNTGKQRKSDTVLFALTVALFAALVFLTSALIMLYSRSTSEGDIPFDLDRLTSDDSSGGAAEIADAILPEFIGITTGGKRYGISGSSAVMADIYGELSYTVSETLLSENCRQGDESFWLSCAELADSVYIRYHSELPDVMIGLFADAAADTAHTRDRVNAYIYEMFILPSEDTSGTATVAVRSVAGEVFIYSEEEAENGLMTAELGKYTRSYTSSMKEFVFSMGEYGTGSPTEPVFAEPITTKNILTTDGTAFLIKSSTSMVNRLMRIFGINPNKLLSSHEEPTGKISYTDRTGVLYIERSALEYRAAEDGGIPVEDIIGYTDSIGIGEYISAVYGLVGNIKALESHCAGGSADLYLTEITSNGREVSMRLEFFYDNILVSGTEPALDVTFEDGRLTYARLFTVTVKGIGTRSETFGEWWFFDSIESGGEIRNVGLIYRSDYVADSVSAQWRASVGAAREKRR